MRLLGSLGIAMVLSKGVLGGYISSNNSYSAKSAEMSGYGRSYAAPKGGAATKTTTTRTTGGYTAQQTGVLNKKQETLVANWSKMKHGADYAKDMNLQQLYRVTVYTSITEPVSLKDFGPNMLAELGNGVSEMFATASSDDPNMIYTYIPDEYTRAFGQSHPGGTTTVVTTTTSGGLVEKKDRQSSSSEVSGESTEE
ncbi:hypothetical protein NECID01_0703 [Nematocida sp. AWRm77]|nr:hypothetical protein NECID01_0703 [Nematocida sp. AWRm77]